jgi:putative hydrolase of the HAD superfamily
MKTGTGRFSPITDIFVDIGGVLLTNGSDHLARKMAAKHFTLGGLKWTSGIALTSKFTSKGSLASRIYLKPRGFL